MMRSRIAAIAAVAALAAFLPRPASPSCGSDDCPLGAHGHSVLGMRRFVFDISYQYIDQDNVQIGKESAEVGELPSPEDEISTLSRTVVMAGRVRLAPRFAMSALLPYVDRDHRHFHNHEGEEPELQVFKFDGVGDLSVLGHWTPFGTMATSSLTLQAGVKFPTGVTEVEAVDGHQPEPPALPGTGSTDMLLGAHLMRTSSAPALFGGGAVDVPWFASMQVRLNGKGTSEYQIGNELQVNLGTSYPLTDRLSLLAQLNARSRGKDDVGETDALRDNTGGKSLWISPGLQFAAGAWGSVYGYVQLPIVQDVNRIQIVAPMHILVGTTIPFGS